MKLCTGHQSDLKKALERKGLWRYVALDAAEAQHRTRLWLAGHCQTQELDPLVIVVCEFKSKAMQYGVADTPNTCPLCGAAKLLELAKLPESWIDNCTDQVLLVFKVNGLARTEH